MKNLVTHRVLGKSTAPTIYYFPGYGIPLWLVAPHIRVLRRMGFRVYAFSYKADILSAGEPKLLIEAVETIKEIVLKDMKTHKVAGVYGMSLGALVGLNIQRFCGIKKGLYNTGGVGAVNTIWDNRNLTKEKDRYTENGYSKQDLRRLWAPYEADENTNVTGLEIVLLAAKRDAILSYDEAERNIAAWRKNADAKLVTTSSLGVGHVTVVVRNFLRLRQVNRFYSR